MTSGPQLYGLSVRLNHLYGLSKSLLGLHAGRYRHFVDGSDKGHDCTYARLTLGHFNTQELPADEVRTALEVLEDQVQGALTELALLEAANDRTC